IPMPKSYSSTILRYGLALSSVVIAVGLTMTINPLLKCPFFAFFYGAVGASAGYGGLGPGLVATLLSLLSIRYFFDTSVSFTAGENLDSLLRSSVFILVSVMIGSLNSTLERSQRIAKENVRSAQASEESLRLALEAAHLGLWLWDLPTDRFTWTEPTNHAKGGAGKREVRYIDFIQSIHPDDRKLVETALFEAMDQCKNCDVEYRMTEGPETEHWFALRGRCTYGSGGEALSMTGVAINITERKQAEIAAQIALQREQEARTQAESTTQDLLESQSRYHQTQGVLDKQRLLLETILKQAASAVIVSDAQGRLTFTNAAARRLAHQDPDNSTMNLNLLDWGDAYDTDGRLVPVEDYAMNRALKGEVCNAVQSRLVHGDGSYHDILISAAPLKQNGEIIGAVGTFIDITDRTQAEEALRQSEERLRVALKNLPIAVFNQDLDLHYTWIYHPSFEYQVGEVIGKRDEDLTEAEDAAVLTRIKQRVLKTGTGAREETKLTVNGCSYYYDLTVEPLRNDHHEIVGLTGAAIDISDRKQVEQEKEQLLQRERAAREDAERANRIKDEFLAVLSHELRSPLNPILGWSQLLRTRQFNFDKTQKALETIERNARLQSQLIEDLLDVSRILRGKLQLNVTTVNLATTIELALETVRLAAEAKSIQIKSEVIDSTPPDSPFPATQSLGFPILGDAARLQQVVWNLLSNAVKFTPIGGQVEVVLQRVGVQAQIIVQDTGRGIKPEFLPYVFDYFRQADSTTTRQFGGLGLGLAIVRHIVELHGGTVQAESPGEDLGSTFTVQFPLKLIPTPPLPDSQPTPETSGLEGICILVVDDEADMRELTALVLEECGAIVQLVDSGIEALAALDHSLPNLPNIIVCDIGMPQMDGYMLIQQIRSRPPEAGGNIPAIALTAYAGEFNRQRALNAGFQRHLSKPVDTRELVATLLSLLQQSSEES
ncbi:MAG: ATP-binding protein, partial [Leptolyngbyaceae cyanobacterium bins.59]|nr:ATP-binding protein [Leptolyngbyaceae cyanobacterium bins.59]